MSLRPILSFETPHETWGSGIEPITCRVPAAIGRNGSRSEELPELPPFDT